MSKNTKFVANILFSQIDPKIWMTKVKIYPKVVDNQQAHEIVLKLF